ncbi:hypothetical protein LTR78_007477 [Recurvomyces mirabilis]|uniref:FAM192A/Fyv6 N-terminal domain-containing protein n=1 Tax=Recurvomyces mirabilis TaxID=574656 RepID=A0AAE0WJB1_9PEZI|nr:hypothetical protein LTR78_007477 [Recurvomyces mirabilis]KAK5160013.1 hypothetical protein LTS14_002119 [Recurvomyces mirabilis]
MSRFVSAGTDEAPTERDEAWQKAQQQIEATKQPKLRPGEQEGGKSLYETLQANKVAKQDAFEDASRLRNQFRSLDEDEIEFLESVMESSRSKEAEVKKDTKEQLEAFRKQQEDAEKAAQQDEGSAEVTETTSTWSVGPRKRKKEQNAGFGGVKVRRTSTAKQEEPSTTNKPIPPSKGEKNVDLKPSPTVHSASEKKANIPEPGHVASSPTSARKPSTPPAATLGLGAYSSDEDD